MFLSRSYKIFPVGQSHKLLLLLLLLLLFSNIVTLIHPYIPISGSVSIISNCSTPQYLSFGLSGSNSRTSMDGADTAVAWVDSSGRPNAVDYYLQPEKRFQVSHSRS